MKIFIFILKMKYFIYLLVLLQTLRRLFVLRVTTSDLMFILFTYFNSIISCHVMISIVNLKALISFYIGFT